MPYRSLLSALSLCLLCWFAAAEETDDQRDRVLLKDARGALICTVVREAVEGVVFRMTPSAPEIRRRWSEVVSIDYAHQRNPEGPLQNGLKNLGRPDIAATIFASGFSAAKHEPEKVDCAFREGEAWETAKKFESAAAAYAKVVSAAPKSRQWLEAKYRQAFALAIGGKATESEALAVELEALGKNSEGWGSAARNRATAVRAANLSVANKNEDAESLAAKVIFSKSEDREAWVRFTFWRATLAATMGKGDLSARLFRELLESEQGNPKADSGLLAKIALGHATALLKADPDRALVALLRIDALPLGGADEKAIARYHAGRLLIEQSDRLSKSQDQSDQRRDFARSMLVDAQLMLSSSANGSDASADIPERELARALLTTLQARIGATASTPASATAAATK